MDFFDKYLKNKVSDKTDCLNWYDIKKGEGVTRWVE